MSDTQNKWVPVSERLPDDARRVLVMTTTGEQFVAFIGACSNAWTLPGLGPVINTTCRSVTHWMDLPAPPKPTDPFEAWWDRSTDFQMQIEAARAAWNAAKEHYAKPLPDFETWWKTIPLREDCEANVRDVGMWFVHMRCARAIWNAAQGKPEAQWVNTPNQA